MSGKLAHQKRPSLGVPDGAGRTQTPNMYIFLHPIKERFTSDLHVKARGSMLIQSLSEIQTAIASKRPENGRLAGKDVVDDLGY